MTIKSMSKPLQGEITRPYSQSMYKFYIFPGKERVLNKLKTEKMNIPYNKNKLYKHTCSMSDEGSWYVTTLIERTKEKESVIEFDLDVMSISLNHYAWGKKLNFYDKSMKVIWIIQ